MCVIEYVRETVPVAVNGVMTPGFATPAKRRKKSDLWKIISFDYLNIVYDQYTVEKLYARGAFNSIICFI